MFDSVNLLTSSFRNNNADFRAVDEDRSKTQMSSISIHSILNVAQKKIENMSINKVFVSINVFWLVISHVKSFKQGEATLFQTRTCFHNSSFEIFFRF